MNSDIVWFWIVKEPDGYDVRSALQQGCPDSMHAVHDATIA